MNRLIEIIRREGGTPWLKCAGLFAIAYAAFVFLGGVQ